MCNIAQIISEFTEVSNNPAKMLEKYLEDGKKVIGCFPEYTPEEIVHAAGMIPMGLWGGQVMPSYAGQYIMDPFVKTPFFDLLVEVPQSFS